MTMWFALTLIGVAVVVSFISHGTEESTQLYYDLEEDASDCRGGNKKTSVSVSDEAAKPQKVKADNTQTKASSPAQDDADTLAQSIYDSVEM